MSLPFTCSRTAPPSPKVTFSFFFAFQTEVLPALSVPEKSTWSPPSFTSSQDVRFALT
jgi:hypothetical protein